MTVPPEWTSVNLQPKVSKDVSQITKLSQSSKSGEEGVRGKSVATQKRSAPTPQFLEEKVRAFFFSCAASIHGLATCRFALISVSACAFFLRYIYIIEFIYIYNFCFVTG